MTRRTDTGLRHAISVIERMLLTDPTIDTILMRCLHQLMALLGSHFGYVYQCRNSESESVPWELTGCYQFDSGVFRELANTCTSHHIPPAMQAKLISGRCIFDDGLETPLHPVPHEHPDIFNYCCIPLVDARRIYAVVYLCNVAGGFDEALENRLRPFIAAASCLLRAAEKKNRFQQATPSACDIAAYPELFLDLLDTMFNGVLVVNEADTITLCNHAAASMLGLPRREVIGLPRSRFLPKGAPRLQHRLDLNDNPWTAAARKTVWRGVPALTAAGKKFLVDLSAFELNEGEQVLRGLVMDDISERMQSAADYHATLQRFQVLTNLAPVAIVQLNREWECTYANDTWCEYCQMTPDEAHHIGWLRGLHTGDAENFLDTLRTETAVSGKYEGELRLQSPLGRVTWVKANACSLYNEEGETSGMIMTLSDITDRLSNERRLQDIAEKDQLTGLINRAFFNDRVEIALKGVRRFGYVALMFLDLDEFKHINDTLGHDAGDQLLREVANRLRDTLRQVDTIARIGGDEFTVLLTNVQNVRGITATADKLIAALASPVDIDKRPIYLTCSIGIAVAESENTDTKQLLKQADVALYKAKEAGKNQYKFYTPELDKNANLHILLRQSLKETGRRDFRVVYQPQVDASCQKIVGLEALARWSHPDTETIDPQVFIKMIEETALINDFSEWLFEEVFSTVSHWLGASDPEISVSLNLSAKQFRNKELASFIHHRCRAHGINPRKIVLEVTETALIDDPEIAANTLKMLRRMGFSISLDDFGTGYSSLLYLRDMPLQCVKIDRSFIRRVSHDDEDAKIVSAILALADALELNVIAEGVDNADDKSWLLDHGCPIQQGFLFHKPLEAREVENLLHLSPPKDNVVSFGGRVG